VTSILGMAEAAMRRRVPTAVLVLMVPLLAAACAVDLGTLKVADNAAESTAVNDSGTIVGLSGNPSTNSPDEAFRKAHGGPMEPLVPLAGDVQSDAYGLNDEGVAVGKSCTPFETQCRAVMWGRGGAAVDIGVIGNIAQAVSINDFGVVIGDTETIPLSRSDPFVERAFYWSPGDQSMIELPLAPGATQSSAVAVNDLGEVAGNMTFPDGSHVVRWHLGSNIIDDYGLGSAFAMNGEGAIAGQVDICSSQRCDFVGAIWFTGQASPTLVGTLGGRESEVYGINDAGVAVGGSDIPGSDTSHAFAWSAHGGIVDLGTLDGRDSVALAINNHNLAVGTGTATGTGINSHAAAFTIRLPAASAAPSGLQLPLH
jgi:probable HAF family extracellular repeat protein